MHKINLKVKFTDPLVAEAFISEDKSTIRFSSKREGLTLVRVYVAEQETAYDEFMIITGSIIIPKSPAIVLKGGVVNFRLE